MRFALISDIHANLEALTAVLADIESEGVDKIHCLGDVVGYGCDPVGCLELVEKHCEVKLLGNHEYLTLGLADKSQYNEAAIKSYEWTVKQLGDYELGLIENYVIDHREGEFYFVHASPHIPTEWHYVLNSTQADMAFASLEKRVGFVGHSHVPAIFAEMPDAPARQKVGHDFLMDPDYRYLLNVGSVGQPRDMDPRACYVIVDSEEGDVFFNRVDYDIKKTQEKLKKISAPELLIERLSLGR